MPFSVDDTPFGSLSVTLADVDGTLSASIMATAPATLSLAVYGAPPGVPPNGTEGQILVKASDAAWDTEWVDNYATELRIVARNVTGSTLAKGTVVYINGAAGNKPTVTKAIATGDSTSAQTLGMVSADIPNNQNGEVTVRGLLTGLDTSAFAAGTQLYLSGTTAGGVTSTKPSAPVHLVYVGIVSRQHANQGQVEVAIQNGFELHELHDVQIVSPTNGQVLKYDSATGLWKNGTDVGGVAWGGITGTLSAQTDLQNALDAKATAADFLSKAGNLSGLASVSTARTNLGLGSANTVAFRTVNLSEGSADADDTLSQISAATVANGFSLSGSNSAYVENPNQFVVVDSSQSFLFTKTGFNFHSYPTYDIIQSPSVATTGGELDYVATTGVLTIRVFDNLASPATDDTITISPAGITFADSTQQTTAFIPGDYLTSTEIGTTYAPLNSPALTGTPTSTTPATADDSTAIATTAFVKAQGYLTTAPVTSVAGKTGAVTLAVADVSGAAPTASPALTGTPTAPTAAAATNTTQIATTAFVQQEVPAASTTAAGKVELATIGEALDGDNATVVTNVEDVQWMLMNNAYRPYFNVTGGTSGTGAFTNPVPPFRYEAGTPNTLTAGFAYLQSNNYSGMTVGQGGTVFDFSKKFWMSFHLENLNASSIGDANNEIKVFWGHNGSNNGDDPTGKAVGVWKLGGSSSLWNLMVHDGTTLTKVATSSTTMPTNQIQRFMIYSNGAGTVKLFINGSEVASSNAGPTGTRTDTRFWFSVKQTASAATRFIGLLYYPKISATP